MAAVAAARACAGARRARGTTSIRQAKEAGNRNVLVQSGPVDRVAVGVELVVAAISLRGVAQARKPLERDGQLAAVLEMHHQPIGYEFDRLGPRLSADSRSTHSTSR